MTDNEIIKAIWHCLTDLDCLDCPYVDYEGKERCDEKVLNDLCDLINRQKAEIERLQKLLDDKCDRCIAKDKAEVVKEFAERLKEYVESYDVTTGYKIIIVNAVEEETIDNLVKEMVGENNG